MTMALFFVWHIGYYMPNEILNVPAGVIDILVYMTHEQRNKGCILISWQRHKSCVYNNNNNNSSSSSSTSV